MSAQMFSIKIDLNKVDKSKLFAGKNGASYLDGIMIPSRQSQFGDSHMVVQSVTKEERLAGKKGAILGNAKVIGGGNTRQEDSDTPFGD